MRILVVDDDPLIQKAWKRVGGRLGFHVAGVERGEGALGLAERFGADGIVLDLRLPDADGRDLLARMQRSSALENVPILVLSGHVDDFVRATCLDLGARYVAEKPFDPEMGLRRFARWSGRAAPPDSSLRSYPGLSGNDR